VGIFLVINKVLAERFGHYLFDLVFHVGGDETSEPMSTAVTLPLIICLCMKCQSERCLARLQLV
jgi:hypothetical protein